MSYTVVYSDYNGYPGSEDTYDGRSAVEIPILPDVNLYNSFNFELKATTFNYLSSCIMVMNVLTLTILLNDCMC